MESAALMACLLGAAAPSGGAGRGRPPRFSTTHAPAVRTSPTQFKACLDFGACPRLQARPTVTRTCGRGLMRP